MILIIMGVVVFVIAVSLIPKQETNKVIAQPEENKPITGKLTGEPRQPGLLHGYGQVEMYQRAADETRRILESGNTDMIKVWNESTPESYRDEFIVRAIDDAKHGRR